MVVSMYTLLRMLYSILLDASRKRNPEPNAALHLRRGHRRGAGPPTPTPRRQVQAFVRPRTGTRPWLVPPHAREPRARDVRAGVRWAGQAVMAVAGSCLLSWPVCVVCLGPSGRVSWPVLVVCRRPSRCGPVPVVGWPWASVSWRFASRPQGLTLRVRRWR